LPTNDSPRLSDRDENGEALLTPQNENVFSFSS